MKKITMILLVACVLLAGCEMLPELTTVTAESDGTFDIVVYSDGARMDSEYRVSEYSYTVFGEVSVRIFPIDDSEVKLWINGHHKEFTANVINEF